MANIFKNVYEFKITLMGINPPIWRTIQVPETYSFWDLHVAIQDSMGWTDSHLHEFEIVNTATSKKVVIGIPVESFDDDRDVQAGWEYKIASYFTMDNRAAIYLYDFGDDWRHTVRLEKILAREKNRRYPVCIDGERACPPEDCGGVWGYQEFVKTVTDPTHEGHDEMLEWIGGSFDPEYFDPKKVHFDNPKKRWKHAFE